jgi:Fe2+ transport system protein FeoA
MQLQIESMVTVTLAALQEGEAMIVTLVRRGCGAQGRLVALGLRKGARVEMVRKSRMNGPLIVRVNQSEVAIGLCLAQAIVGEPVSK